MNDSSYRLMLPGEITEAGKKLTHSSFGSTALLYVVLGYGYVFSAARLRIERQERMAFLGCGTTVVVVDPPCLGGQTTGAACIRELGARRVYN